MWSIFREQRTSLKWWAGTSGSTYKYAIDWTMHSPSQFGDKARNSRRSTVMFDNSPHTRIIRFVLKSLKFELSSKTCVFTGEWYFLCWSWSQLIYVHVQSCSHAGCSHIIPTCFMTPLAMTADAAIPAAVADGHVGPGHLADLMVFEKLETSYFWVIVFVILQPIVEAPENWLMTLIWNQEVPSYC